VGRLEQLNLNTQVQSVCVRVSVDVCCSPITITYAVWLKLCGRRRQSVPVDINAQHVVAVCVLELLYTLNCAVRLLSMLAGWAAGCFESCC